ncbi:cysteine-rich repeat secretory protein 38-like [Bidens hawaiensis]|uniref:cysteine-rich repeat secretory protein 38-like n=1 Tax=Bidens hawaiensis TaxID=980011 RepID=UPI00404B61F9
MDTKNLISLIFLLQAIINGVNLSIAQKPGPGQLFVCSSKAGNFTSDWVVERDVALTALLVNRDESKGYYSGTVFGQSETIWGIALCPSTIKPQACRDCANTTVTYLKNNCPKQKEGVAWTSLERVFCMVSYAEFELKGKFNEWAYATFKSPPNQSPYTAAELEKELNNLANKLKGMVTQTPKFYGSGSVIFGPGSRTLYGSMQCTYGIGIDGCMACLSGITNRVHSCSKQRSLSGIAATNNCYFWYRHKNFLP